MTFDQILTAPVNAQLIVNDQEFKISGIEKARLGSGERVTWMWSSEGAWLIVDNEGDELIIFHPVEDEVELDEEGYAMYMGNSFEEEYEDLGTIDDIHGETDHEGGDAFEFKQFENERAEVLRRLTWTGYGEERWFVGKMIQEIDIREA